MPTQPNPIDRLPTEHLARALAVVALAALAVIHLIDLPETWEETSLIGYGYFLLIAGALVAAGVLMTVNGAQAWLFADLVAMGALVAYVLSRTTGLPTDPFDVGNWDCALGIAALSSESVVILLAAWRLLPQRPVHDAPTDGTSLTTAHLAAAADSVG